MKKTLYLIVSLVLCVCCFALVGCFGDNNQSDKDKDNDAAVNSISLDKTTLTLNVGESEKLTATVDPSNAKVTWSTSDSTKVDVDQSGNVTAVRIGTATITAKAGFKEAECTVTVSEEAVGLTEAEWKDAFTAIAGKSFTLDTKMNGTLVSDMKYDGTSLYFKTPARPATGANETGSAEREMIYTKDGSNYYYYSKDGDADWIKVDSTKEEYDRQTGSCSVALSSMSDYFKDKFASFTYENGKYTAASLTITAGEGEQQRQSTLTDIAITFTEKAISAVSYTAQGDGNSQMGEEFSAIGSTTIDLPTIQGPAEGIYEIKDDHAEVKGYGYTGVAPEKLIIASEYQGKPVTVIQQSAFTGQSTIKSVVIPETVTTIQRTAFEKCTNLTAVTIPDSVTFIDSKAFSGCTKLATVTISDDSELTTAGQNVFENTAWFNAQENGVVYIGKVANSYKAASAFAGETVTIKEGTVSISDLAFYNNASISSVTIPGSVKTIGGQAFYECINLATLTLGDGVEEIGAQAFRDCKLTTVTLPASITTLGSWVFAGNSLTAITFQGTQAQWEAVDKDNNWNDYATGDKFDFDVTVAGGAQTEPGTEPETGTEPEGNETEE